MRIPLGMALPTMWDYVKILLISYTSIFYNESFLLYGTIWLDCIVYKGEVMSIRNLLDIRLLLIGLLLYLGGIYVSQWSNLATFATLVGIGGGMLMGLSIIIKQLSKKK